MKASAEHAAAEVKSGAKSIGDKISEKIVEVAVAPCCYSAVSRRAACVGLTDFVSSLQQRARVSLFLHPMLNCQTL